MKAELRRKVHGQLEKLCEKEFFDKSVNLSKNLIFLLEELNFHDKMIGAFSPIQKEPLWFLSFDERGEFALPVLKNGKMEFHKAHFRNLKERSSWLKSKQESIFPEVLIIPGVAFSERMQRLGRGKGFFDKYLEKVECIKIGVCFDEQLFKEIPSNRFDINMDYIVTEKTVLKGNI